MGVVRKELYLFRVLVVSLNCFSSCCSTSIAVWSTDYGSSALCNLSLVDHVSVRADFLHGGFGMLV